MTGMNGWINKTCWHDGSTNQPVNRMNDDIKRRPGRGLLNAAWMGLVLLMALAGCGEQKPRMTRLSAVLYNYAEDPVIAVVINGDNLGAVREVMPGNVSGGGVMCCFPLAEGAEEVDVEVQLPHGQRYVTKAKIEKWWPDLANYGVVHVLPGQKVVMQVTPNDPLPRKDLLEAQQRALGLPVKVNFRMWSAGPIQRLDGKQ
jgi:hypothetical protein